MCRPALVNAELVGGYDMATTTCEVWVVVDENGDYRCGEDCDTAAQRYSDDVVSPDGSMGLRHVKLTLTLPLPAPIEVVVNVPEVAETVGVVVG